MHVMAKVLKRCGCTNQSKCEHAWTVRYWEAGKQREQSFRCTKTEANGHAKRIEAEKLDPHHGSPAAPILFGAYSEMWLAGLTRTAGTKRIHSAAMRRYLVPAFGARQLADVAADREAVQALLASLTASNARVVLTALSALFSEARLAGRVNTYRLSGIRLKDPGAPAEFVFPEHAQLQAVTKAMPEDLRLSVWLMRGCGLRPGECLAVRGDGFKDGRLRVHEQQLRDGYGPLKARKAGEYRDMPVPGYVQAMLPDEPGYLFDVTNNRYQHLFRNAAQAAGLPVGFHPHQLRHCFASVALAAGVPITDVARWLGHRNIQITYRTYSHFIPSAWDDARQALDAEYQSWSKPALAAA
jgi:integrase